MAWVAGYILRWLSRPKTVTHPSTNRVRRGVTSLMRHRRYRYAKPPHPCVESYHMTHRSWIVLVNTQFATVIPLYSFLMAALRSRCRHYIGSRPSDHYFRSVCLHVCLFVCLFVCAEFFSAVFDPISIKLKHMLYVWV